MKGRIFNNGGKLYINLILPAAITAPCQRYGMQKKNVLEVEFCFGAVVCAAEDNILISN